MFSESSREAKMAKSTKILPECTALGGLWEESKVERKIIETIKISVVWTMSDGGYVEK
jgi:hypothetical protein